MLYLYYGEKPNRLVDIPGYFDDVFEDDWITSDISKEIIKEVDKSIVLYPHVIESPVLGPITPKEISGGAKGLILMAHDDDMIGKYFYGGQFGDNTLRMMLKIALTRDIKISVHHIYKFPSNDNIGFEFTVTLENTNETFSSFEEYTRIMREYIMKGII